MAVDRKQERDIDLLLAEEFAVSSEFASWFLNQTGFRGCAATIHDVFVSKSDVTGESDVVAVYEEPAASRRIALLIEDKISAPLQPDQGMRYHLRAQREIERGDYQAYEIVLCAPKAYVIPQQETKNFDRTISYEAIAAFLQENDTTARGRYRANFVATAALRNANSWARVNDDVTNAFWDAAYRIAATEFPILELKCLQLTKDSSWITIRPMDMPTGPRWTYILLKGDRGFVDLTFNKSSVSHFEGPISPLLRQGMALKQTGKSAAIRIETETFRPRDTPDFALPKVRCAFAAGAALVAFYRAHRQLLEHAAWGPVET